MVKILTNLLFAVLCTASAYAQRNCGTYKQQKNFTDKFPEIITRTEALKDNFFLSQGITRSVTIPVVVHIISKDDNQKFTKDQIKNQIKILNDDFAGKNSDITNVPEKFKDLLAGDTGIKFKLIAVTNTRTKQEVFHRQGDSIKFSKSGGKDLGKYLSSKYLNIWVGSIKDSTINGELFGYSSFPWNQEALTDGVVVNYRYFGTRGDVANYDKGRTVTHEVGHWLGLLHLWGDKEETDAICAEDYIDDTPPQRYSNKECPLFPKLSECDDNEKGELFVNYMDYVYDDCMVMFTAGQKACMNRNFEEGGLREGFVKLPATKRFPSITQYIGKKFSWLPVQGAESYTLRIKSLDNFQVQNFTTKSTSSEEINLDSSKLYEISVESTKNDESISGPTLLINPK